MIVLVGELVKTPGYSLLWLSGRWMPSPMRSRSLSRIARIEERKREQLENAAITAGDRLGVAAASLDKGCFDYLLDYVKTGPAERGRL